VNALDTLRDRLAPRLPAIAAVATVMVVVVVHLFAASRAILPVYWEDEAGYLANARVLAGMAESYDLRGNPYSVGYSILLAPLWWILGSAESVYRGAVVVAALCGIAAIAPAWAIGRRLGLGNWPALVAGGVVALGPAHTSMSSFAVSENLLSLLVLTALALTFRFFAEPGVVNGLALGAASAAAFLTHARVVAILAATALVFVVMFARHLRAALAGLGALTIVAGSGYLVHRAVGAAVFGSASAREDKGLARLFSPDLGGSLVAATGQAWYHAIAWAGLAVVGGTWLVTRLIAELRDRRPAAASWFVLVTVGTVIIAVSYIAPVISRATPRFDVYTYGRYLEPIAYALAVLGAIALVRGIGRRRAYVVAGTIGILIVAFALAVQPIIPRVAESWFAPLNVGGMWWAPWPIFSRIGGSPWWPMAVLGIVAATAIILLRRTPRIAVALLAVALTAQSLVGLANVRVPFGAPFADSLTLRTVLADPALEGERVQFDVAVDDPERDVDSANQNAYQVFAPTPVELFDSRRDDPTADLVIARVDWPRAHELGARRLAVDEGVFDNALWVLPGPLADRLVGEGMIEG
jgi:hypothetical protein